MTPIPAPTPTPQAGQPVRVPVLWGLAFGVIQAASPLALRLGKAGVLAATGVLGGALLVGLGLI